MNQPNNNRPLGYEPKDVNFGMLVMLTGLLFLLLGGILFFGRYVDHFFSRHSVPKQASESALADMNRLPPEPRLQVNPPLDMIRLRDVENVKLSNYSWIDPDAGKVRIPISRAMAILADREAK